jgi:type II secretory pathway pseudopilin PulG
LAALALIVVAVASALVAWSITKATRTSQSSYSVAECLQGQLQVAIEQGGGLAGTVPATFGYTFLVVNTGAKSCELRGYPHEIIFSTNGGEILKVKISHERTVLYAQPKVHRIVIRPGGAASFGISYNYGIAPPGGEPTTCLAPFIDLRLPALSSHLFSYEFPVRMDVCEAGRRVEVTPVERGTAPKA